MRFERQEAHSSKTSSYGYSNDEDEDVNPFASWQVREETIKESFLHTFDTIKVGFLEFDYRLWPEEFLDWLCAVEKFFKCRDVVEYYKIKASGH